MAIAADDGLLAGYILAATRYIEGQIHRPIVSRLIEYTTDWTWTYLSAAESCSPAIELPYPPLRAVRSVQYVDQNGAQQTLQSNQYTVLTNRARGLIVPAYNTAWPAVRWQPEAIRVRYIAGSTGFVDQTTSPEFSVSGPGIPDELRQAVLMLVGFWYENREGVNIGNITSELPFAVEALISPSRAVSFG